MEAEIAEFEQALDPKEKYCRTCDGLYYPRSIQPEVAEACELVAMGRYSDLYRLLSSGPAVVRADWAFAKYLWEIPVFGHSQNKIMRVLRILHSISPHARPWEHMQSDTAPGDSARDAQFDTVVFILRAEGIHAIHALFPVPREVLHLICQYFPERRDEASAILAKTPSAKCAD